eukprot:5343766-Amphidinium_carterae.2
MKSGIKRALELLAFGGTASHAMLHFAQAPHADAVELQLRDRIRCLPGAAWDCVLFGNAFLRHSCWEALARVRVVLLLPMTGVVVVSVGRAIGCALPDMLKLWLVQRRKKQQPSKVPGQLSRSAFVTTLSLCAAESTTPFVGVCSSPLL